MFNFFQKDLKLHKCRPSIRVVRLNGLHVDIKPRLLETPWSVTIYASLWATTFMDLWAPVLLLSLLFLILSSMPTTTFMSSYIYVGDCATLSSLGLLLALIVSKCIVVQCFVSVILTGECSYWRSVSLTPLIAFFHVRMFK